MCLSWPAALCCHQSYHSQFTHGASDADFVFDQLDYNNGDNRDYVAIKALLENTMNAWGSLVNK
jgi:hypothetical protein